MNGKPSFNETFDNPDADPLDGRGFIVDPWPEILSRFGESEQDERDRADVCSAVREAFHWVVQPFQTGHRKIIDRLIGRRALALVWLLDPGLIEGSPSLSEAARRMGLHKVALSIHAAQARRAFGVRNRSQSHAWNFQPDPNNQAIECNDPDSTTEDED